MPPRSDHRLTVRQHSSFVRSFQTGDDIEQRRFSAATRPDDDDEFAFLDFERHIIQRMPGLALLLKPFRNVIDDQLGWWRSTKFFLKRHQGFWNSLERSSALLMKPALTEFCMNFSTAARGVSAVNTIRFHAAAITCGLMSLFVSSSSSALIKRCASSGFFSIQSVNSACAWANFFARSRFSFSNLTLETNTVVATSFSCTITLPDASCSRRVSQGSTVQTPSIFFALKRPNWSGFCVGITW